MNSDQILKQAQEFNRLVDENKAEAPAKKEVSKEDKNKAWDKFERKVNRNRKIPTARLPYFNQLNDSLIDGKLPSEDEDF